MKAPIPLWAAALAAHLLLLFLLLLSSFSFSSYPAAAAAAAAADRDRCPWLFYSCGRPAGTECRVVLRRQCNCSALIKSLGDAGSSGVVLEPSDAAVRTECVELDAEQHLNVSLPTAKHILETQLMSIARLCHLVSCSPVPHWCSWGPWTPISSDCRYLIASRKQKRCCHPVTGERLNMKCEEVRRLRRLEPPVIPDCLRTKVNVSDSNRTAPTSPVQNPQQGTGELTYAYLAIGLFICVCFVIAFPYRHIYRLCASDSPDSSNCSTPNLYEQVPMEVQISQVVPYEETVMIEREPDDSEIGISEVATKSDDAPSPETLLTEPSVVEG